MNRDAKTENSKPAKEKKQKMTFDESALAVPEARIYEVEDQLEKGSGSIDYDCAIPETHWKHREK